MSTDRPANSRSEQEFDQQILRVAILLNDEFSQTQAAWLLGRLCNEIQHRFRLAWIRYRDSEPERTTRIWSDLRRLAQEATADTALTGSIQQTKTQWESCFKSEWHSDAIYDADCVLRRHLFDGEQLPYAMSEINFIINSVQYPEDFLGELCTRIRSQLSTELDSAFQLGLLADQIIHPPLSDRSLRVDENPVEGTDHNPEEQLENEQTASPFLESSENEFADVSIGNRLHIREIWPHDELIRDIQHCLAQYCRIVDTEFPQFASRWTPNTSKSTILDELETLICDIELDDGETHEHPIVDRLTRRGQRVCRSLSLSVDVVRGDVTRLGSPMPVHLPPRLSRLLVHFLNSHAEQFPARWIGEHWQHFSPRTNGISSGSVYAQINRINEILGVFDLCLDAEANGYVLRDLRSRT